jgi:cysteine desulfurase
MRKVYLDHNATTHLIPEVLEAMTPYFSEISGNPLSVHWAGRDARTAIDTARDTIARIIGAKTLEIVFTSSGTEANNLAIKGVAFRALKDGNKKHIITTSGEHHSVLNPIKFLAELGFKVTYIPLDNQGIPDIDFLKSSIKSETILVSVMYVNNETGNIFPVDEVVKVCKENGVLLHIDAVQALCKVPVDVRGLGADIVSFSAHKIYGPKGAGALWIRDGVLLEPILHGGEQEEGLRAGTHNVAAIVGFAEAVKIGCERMEQYTSYVGGLRDSFEKAVLSQIPDTFLNGHARRVCNSSNIGFRGVEGETLVMALDLEGIAISTGSACASGTTEPSHVLKAMGLSEEDVRSSVRFSFGMENTPEDVEYTLQTLKKVVSKLRG